LNEARLKQAERWFLTKYPGGFAHPELTAVGKKYRLEKMQAFVEESFAKKKFRHRRPVGRLGQTGKPRVFGLDIRETKIS